MAINKELLQLLAGLSIGLCAFVIIYKLCRAWFRGTIVIGLEKALEELRRQYTLCHNQGQAIFVSPVCYTIPQYKIAVIAVESLYRMVVSEREDFHRCKRAPLIIAH